MLDAFTCGCMKYSGASSVVSELPRGSQQVGALVPLSLSPCRAVPCRPSNRQHDGIVIDLGVEARSTNVQQLANKQTANVQGWGANINAETKKTVVPSAFLNLDDLPAK